MTSTVCVQDGFIYVGRKKSKLFAVDPESGASTWVHEGGTNPFEDSKCKDPGHDPIIM
jgi:glucose dehydrogenase